MIFQARSYCKGVHESFKKRVCDACMQVREGDGCIPSFCNLDAAAPRALRASPLSPSAMPLQCTLVFDTAQYNDAGRYELSCAACHAVWYCSAECQARAQGITLPTTAPPRAAAGPRCPGSDAADASVASVSAAAESAGASSSVAIAAPPPLPPSELHALDCALLRRLASGCKLDKGRMGVARLILRAYRKMQWEQMEEAQKAAAGATATGAAPTPVDPVAAIPAAPLSAGASSPTHSQHAHSHAYIDDAGDVQQDWLLPAPLVPSWDDVVHLVGHPPPPIARGAAPTPHQLDTIDMRRHLSKLVAAVEAAPPSCPAVAGLGRINVETLVHLLSQVEANGFGLYALSSARKAAETAAPASNGPPESASCEDAAAAAAIDSLHLSAAQSSPPPVGDDGTPVAAVGATARSPSAAATSSAVSSSAAAAAASGSEPASAAASSSSSSSSSSSVSKYVGVLIYPAASYFNHSCAPNVRAVQAGPLLSLCAARDIDAGEELCIGYIDCNKPAQARRSDNWRRPKREQERSEAQRRDALLHSNRCARAHQSFLCSSLRRCAMCDGMAVCVCMCVCVSRSELFDLYRFECNCARCVDELQLHASATAASAASKTKVKERVSYANDTSRQRHAYKKGPPKRKKIEAKIPQQQTDEP